MKATEFDRRFDDGEDVSEHIDCSKARRPNLTAKRVNVDFPAWWWKDWTGRRSGSASPDRP